MDGQKVMKPQAREEHCSPMHTCGFFICIQFCAIKPSLCNKNIELRKLQKTAKAIAMEGKSFSQASPKKAKTKETP